MQFENYAVPENLNANVEAIFYFKNFVPSHAIERVIPTGHTFLIFELDGMRRTVFDNETLNPIKFFSNVWISGPHRNFLTISAHPDSEMLVVQFKPYGLQPFLPVNLSEVIDQVKHADEIFGVEIVTLREEMRLEEDVHKKFELISNWLSAQFNSKKVAPNYLSGLILELQREPVSELKEIISRQEISHKQVIHHFKKFVGLTPKYYQRIIRFHEILKKVNQKEKLSWTEIAYACAYSDQSHFIKEFYLFSGFNPKEFIQKDFSTRQTNFFPLDMKG